MRCSVPGYRASLRGSCLVLVVLAGCLSSAEGGRPKNVVVFGDSLSDNGNGTNPVVQAFFHTNQVYPPIPYFKGRWSNGPTWPEYYSHSAGVNLIDRAVGSSTVDPSGSHYDVGPFFPVPPNGGPSHQSTQRIWLATLEQQVNRFLEEIVPGREDLHVMMSGNNDLMRWIENVTTTDGILETVTSVQPGRTFRAAAAGMQRALDALYAAGARKFVVSGLWAVGQVPIAHVAGPEIQAALDVIQVDADQIIRDMVVAWQATHPEALAAFFSLANVLNGIIANYAALGFLYPHESCITSLLIAQFSGPPYPRCEDPAKHVFWDEVHPTTETHALIAQEVLKATASFYL